RLNWTLYAGNGSTISFELINGTYDYSPLGTSGYAPTYSQGQLTVSGSLGAASFLIGYVQVEYLVDFEVTGLPSSIAWILALDGTNYTIRADSFEVSLANGSYPFSAEAGGPYSLSLPVGPLVVEGAPRNVTLRFTPEPGRLLVSVSPGAAELSINGTVASGMNGSYSADLPPGTYLVNATESGYAPFTEIVTVGPGEVVPVSITLVPLHPSPMHTSPGPSHASTIPLGTLELVGGVIALLAAVLIAVLLATRRPRPPASG
ncbi:MAG: carboxypeptidase regulatory-like domain-containing protein, partial [Thermoplasmata archaeon]